LQRAHVRQPVGHREERGDRADVPNLVVGQPRRAGLVQLVVPERGRGGGEDQREVDDGARTGRQLGLPGVGRHPVGDLGVLHPHPQDRAVRHDAVDAPIGAGRGNDDQLSFRFAEPLRLLHERVVVVQERAQLRRPPSQGAEHVRHESRILRDHANAGAQILGHVVEIDVAESTNRMRRAHGSDGNAAHHAGLPG
jgi:hypothetical protein